MRLYFERFFCHWAPKIFRLPNFVANMGPEQKQQNQ